MPWRCAFEARGSAKAGGRGQTSPPGPSTTSSVSLRHYQRRMRPWRWTQPPRQPHAQERACDC
eukprot:12314445-Prorocentrum_lima.AAC.1